MDNTSQIIDTPAHGFPRPDMTPPTRRKLDVGALLTRGARARAIQRTEAHLTVDGPNPEVNTFVEGIINEPAVADRIVADTVAATLAFPLGVPHVTIPATTFPPLDIEPLVVQMSRQMAAEQDVALRNAFDGGRAYERGATLRRGVGKSFGSRRVQADGIAADYLRDDPQRGATLAALVLAGFTGADPASIL